MALLASVKNVRQLCLSGQTITDASTAHLAAIADLRELDVQGTAITDKGVRTLLGRAELESLEVPPSAITESVVPFVAKHPSLRRLNSDQEQCLSTCNMEAAYSCRIGGCGANYDERCVQLAKVYCSNGCADDPEGLRIGLDGTPLVPTGLRRLAAIPKRLRLWVDQPDDAVLEALSTLASLDSLNCLTRGCVILEGTSFAREVRAGKLSPAAFGHLAKLKQIRTLQVPPALITDDAVEALATMPNLRALNLEVDFRPQDGFYLRDAKALTRRGVEHLTKVGRLTSLTLPLALVDDEVLSVVSDFRHLRVLNCDPERHSGTPTPGCIDLTETKVTAKGLSALKKLGRRMHSIRLDKALVTDSTLAFLASLDALDSVNCEADVPTVSPSKADTCVDLTGTEVTEKGLSALRGFRSTLNFTVPPELISDRTLAELTTRVKIDSLNCNSLGHDPLDPYRMPTWMVPACFELAGTAVTEAGIARLKRLRPLTVILPDAVDRARAEKLLPGTKVYIEDEVTYYQEYVR